MTLFFIEDELETRKGILKYVDWEKLGIDSVVPFANPLEALARAEQEHVDIVLSDIRMPHMDGIQLCQNILNINPSASIIFISGYSDKEYLLSAIQMSAVDYVEKPINVPQLESAIERAILKIRQIHSMQETKQAALKIVQQGRQLCIDQTVRNLIHGRPPFWDATSELKSLHLQHRLLEEFPLNNSDFYRVYLWRCSDNTTGFASAIQSISALLMKQKGMFPFLISMKDEQNCLFVTRFSSHLTCDTQQINLTLMHGIREAHAEHSISCSYGFLLQGTENIKTSYHQAVIAIQKTFFSGYGTILPYQEYRTTQNINACPSAPVPELLEGIRKNDRVACENSLKQFYRTCQVRPDLLPDLIKNEYFKLLSVFTENIPTVSAFQSQDPTIHFLWKQLNQLKTLKECHAFCLSEITRYFDRPRNIMSDKKIILEVVQYIQEQYSNHELYIDQIAKQVHMSPNYLSTLFKQETGKTIGNYITEVRLEQSCHLLISDKKLSDVALAVGYTDMNYYSKLFKKHYHMTPSEYRKHISAK